MTDKNSDEWFTPVKTMIRVHEFFGPVGIELDPASCDMAQRTVKAARYYTKNDDGLSHDWHASTLFLNPPYNKLNGISQQETWSAKLHRHVMSGDVRLALMLVSAASGSAWYATMLNHWPVCIPHQRIRFVDENGKAEGSPRAGRAIFLMYSPAHFGRWQTIELIDRFENIFGGNFGNILFTPTLARRLYPFR